MTQYSGPVPAKAYLHPDGKTALVDCPFCWRWHSHGAAMGLCGSRHPHCPDPHTRDTDYTLVDCGPATPQVMRTIAAQEQRNGRT